MKYEAQRAMITQHSTSIWSVGRKPARDRNTYTGFMPKLTGLHRAAYATYEAEMTVKAEEKRLAAYTGD
jgi:hypothetical protein